MQGKNREIDIAKNLKMVEWLKAELVDSVGALFKALVKTGNDAVEDALATIIIVIYLLGRRVGISFYSLDILVKSKLNASLNQPLEIEHWYGKDLSELLNYLNNKKR